MSSSPPIHQNLASPLATADAASDTNVVEPVIRNSESDERAGRGVRFWLVYVALCLALLLAALDLVSFLGSNAFLKS